MSKSSVDLERLSAAVEQVESGGNPNAVSPKGAEGLMQVMPKTAKRPGYGVMPARDKSLEEKRRVGRDYLAAMVNKYDDVDNALVAYNWGPRRTDEWLRKGADPNKLPMETQKYVPRVRGLMAGTAVPTMQVAEQQSPDRAGLDNQKFIEARAAARGTRRASTPAVPSSVVEGPLKGLSLAHATGVEKIGPSYQAALALSMGAGARPEEQEALPEEVPEESAQPSRASVALASLKEMPVSSAFGASRAMASGGLAGDEDYTPIDFLPPESYESSPAKLLTLRKTPQSSSVSELSKMPIPGGMEQKQETVTAKNGKKGSAKADLAALEYKLALQSASVKDRQQGLGSSTAALGSPALTRRSDINKPSLNVAYFDKGGTASQMLEVLKGYGRKAQEFAVENMISPADIATLALKAKRMVPAGMLTYSGSLNEGEDEEIARMRANDKPPVPRAEGSPEAGETGAAYGNPALLASGEKMRARKMLEQLDKKKQDEPVTRDPTEAEAFAGPPLSVSSGMAPREDRLPLLFRYSKEQGVVAPKWVEDAANAVASPIHAYRHGNIGPEEAMNVGMNVMGGGIGTSAVAKTPVGPGTLGMFLGKAGKTYNPAAEALLLKLEKEGATPQEIYRITQEKFGHPYGRSPVDQQIKYEISDQGASFKPLANERTVQPDKYGRSSLYAGAPFSRVEEVYHHPELQAAHPDLMKKTFLGLENTPEASGAAMFDTYNVDTVPTAMDKFVGMLTRSHPEQKRGQKIHVSGPDEATRKDVLTHELNHFIQNLNKGWEGGSNLGRAREMYPDLMHVGMEERLKPIDFMDFVKDLKKQKPDQADKMSVADMVKQYQEKHVKPSNENLAEYRKLHKQGYFGSESSNQRIRDADVHVAAGIYNRISGEAEARLAAHRSNLSPKQLGENYPYEPNYFKTATDENLKDILHGPVTRADGSPKEGERSLEKTARDDYDQFRKNIMESPDKYSEFELRAGPNPSKALVEDMKGTNLQKVPPRTYFYNDSDLNALGWTAGGGKNKGAIVVAGRESSDPKKIRNQVNTIGHELHHRREVEVGDKNMPLHPSWPYGGISPEEQYYNYNPRAKIQEVMNEFAPERTPSAQDHPTDISSMHWGIRPNKNTQEQVANLAGYEAMQKTGTPLSATPVGKAMMEKDPALLDYFYSQTSAGRPGGGVWDMNSPEYKRAVTPSMKEKAAEMFKKWLISRGINTVNR